MSKKYSAVLSNRDSIFDSGVFDSVQELIDWAAGRGGSYVIQIDGGGCPMSISATCRNGATYYKYYYICEWVPVTADDIARMI